MVGTDRERVRATVADATEIPADVDLTQLDAWERHLWMTPDLTAEERRAAIAAVREAKQTAT